MIKRERMKIIEDLEVLKDGLEGYISTAFASSVKAIDCKKVVFEIEELIRYVGNNTKIEGDTLVKLAKIKNIVKSVQKDL